MILRDELLSIGRFTRPHGVQGEMSLLLTDDVFDRADVDCLVCSIDGIFVPFFIDDWRYKTNNVVLVKFERVDTVEQARLFANREAFVMKKDYVRDDDELVWDDFIGFTAEDGTLGPLGTVDYVDDSTLNVLFVIRRPDGTECFVPAQEVFIQEIDPDNHHIVFNLPDGLLD